MGWIDLERLRKETPHKPKALCCGRSRDDDHAGPPSAAPCAVPPRPVRPGCAGCTLFLPSRRHTIRQGTPSRALPGCGSLCSSEIQRRSGGTELGWAICR